MTSPHLPESRLAEIEARISAATPGLEMSESSRIFQVWKIESAGSAMSLHRIGVLRAADVARLKQQLHGVGGTVTLPNDTAESGESGVKLETHSTRPDESASSEQAMSSTTVSRLDGVLLGYAMDRLREMNSPIYSVGPTDCALIATEKLGRDLLLLTRADLIMSFLAPEVVSTESRTWSYAVVDVTPSRAEADAHARTDLPALLAAYRAARAEIERMREEQAKLYPCHICQRPTMDGSPSLSLPEAATTDE